MKDIYMPFSRPMVIANQAGLKNQTRRLMKLPEGYEWNTVDHFQLEDGVWVPYLGGLPMGLPSIKCHIGQDGDRLCVKEALVEAGCGAITYQADSKFCLNPNTPETNLAGEYSLWPWKVKTLIPRYMPHFACRSKYEIIKISAERLLRISAEDCLDEGIERIKHIGITFYKNYLHKPSSKDNRAKAFGDPRDSYYSLWNSLHEDCPSDTSPWVWKILYQNPARHN